MSPWIECAVSNVLLATGLTAGAVLLAKWGRRPALVHVLCVLAMLKLITPPLWDVPLLPAPQSEPPVAIPYEPAMARTAMAMPVAERLPSAPPAIDPWTVALLLWACGTLAIVAIGTVRTRRFAGVLRRAQPASAGLRAELGLLARRVGLRRVPELLVVDARVSPMLWPSLWRPRLVLPRPLLATLTPEQRAALLLHELAHVRRGDHWVRRLETAVAALFWWLPTVWWLRRCLRDAEEKCCDAWVVWALPSHERAYADALLSTVDFLSGVRCALPPQASGAGHVHQLKQRLTMIMDATTPRTLGSVSRLAVAGLAVLFLPILPTRAQEKERSESESLREAYQRIEELEKLVDKVVRQRVRADDGAADAARRAAELLQERDDDIATRVDEAVRAALEATEWTKTMEAFNRAVEPGTARGGQAAAKALEQAREALEQAEFSMPDYAETVRKTMEALNNHDGWARMVQLDDLDEDIAETIRTEVQAALEQAGVQSQAAAEKAKLSWREAQKMALDNYRAAMRGSREGWRASVKKGDEQDREAARSDRIEQIQDQIAALQQQLADLQAELVDLQRDKRDV